MGDHGPRHGTPLSIKVATTTITDHIKYASSKQERYPTPISAEHYLWKQLFQHTKTDPLNNILDHLKKYPPTPNIANTTSKEPNNNSTVHEHTAPKSIQNNNEKVQEEINTNKAENSQYSNDGENVIRTRYGRVVKKPRQTKILKGTLDS